MAFFPSYVIAWDIMNTVNGVNEVFLAPGLVQPIYQPINKSTSQSVNQPTKELTNLPTNQSKN